MIRDVASLHDSLPVVRNHHERWDGTGIPISSRAGIFLSWPASLRLPISYDAITSDRPYRNGLSVAGALLA